MAGRVVRQRGDGITEIRRTGLLRALRPAARRLALALGLLLVGGLPSPLAWVTSYLLVLAGGLWVAVRLGRQASAPRDQGPPPAPPRLTLVARGRR
jgi:hypothetical protein